MTRSARPKPTAAPLATTIRAALAGGWHTLDALDAMAGRAKGQRIRVHEALDAIRADGTKLDQQINHGLVEVRIAVTRCPAHRPSDDVLCTDVAGHDGPHTGLDALACSVDWDGDAAPRCEARTFGPDGGRYQCDRSGCDGQHEVDYSGPMHKRGDLVHRWTDAPAPPPPRPDHDLTNRVTDLARECMEVGVSGPREWTEAIDSLDLSEEEAERMRPVWTSAQDAWRRERVEGEPASAAPSEPAPRLDAPAPLCEPSAPGEAADGAAPPKGPGPGARCAVCARPYARHADAAGATYAGPEGHPFAPKPRGRPRVAALDAPSVEAPADGDVEREMARGGSGETSDDASTTRGDRPTGRGSVGHEATPRQAVARKPRVRHEAAHPVAAQDSADASRDDARSAPVVEKGREAVSEAPRCPSVWHDVQCEREAGHPCDTADEPGRHHSAHGRRSGWTDEAAAGWARRRAEEERAASRGGKAKRAPAEPVPQPPPCRPPTCHWDDIIEPARVHRFARPLCEAHRARVEGAGGTVTAGVLQ